MTLLLEYDNEEIYSAQFSFLNDRNSYNLSIFGFQGRNTCSLDTLKIITKKLHGVRPRNLMIFLIREICNNLNINTIKALSSQKHIMNCTRVKNNNNFFAEYNQYWEEENGEKEGNFYNIPVEETRKTMEEITSKKRSMYKKRFTMLDDFKERIAEKFENLLEN